MYKKSDAQRNLDDFNQPLGLEMNPDNRWIKKARLVPWEDVERRYAELFRSKEGNVAKPARLALGALLIQMEYRFSDEETVAMIQENPYFQYFCGLPGYTDAPPFDPSLMVYFRKRFTKELLGEINDRIIADALKRKPKEPPMAGGNGTDSETGTKDSDSPETVSSENDGTLIVDATCAPSYIKYPQDTDLLETARQNTERMISILRDPRTARRLVRIRAGREKNTSDSAESGIRRGRRFVVQ